MTGTLPYSVAFMALPVDLPYSSLEHWQGHITRLYRHDLESFIWLLPWAALNYPERLRIDPLHPLLRPWVTGNYETCFRKKCVFLSNVPNFDGSWEKLDHVIFSLLKWTRNEFNDRRDVAMEACHSLPGREKKAWVEKLDCQVFGDIMETIESALEDMNCGAVSTSTYHLLTTPEEFTAIQASHAVSTNTLAVTTTGSTPPDGPAPI